MGWEDEALAPRPSGGPRGEVVRRWFQAPNSQPWTLSDDDVDRFLRELDEAGDRDGADAMYG